MPQNRNITVIYSDMSQYDEVFEWQNSVWSQIIEGQSSQILWCGQPGQISPHKHHFLRIRIAYVHMLCFYTYIYS